MTLQQIYDTAIKQLPATERLKLATLILAELSPRSIIDYREDWSDEDMREFSVSTWNKAPDEVER